MGIFISIIRHWCNSVLSLSGGLETHSKEDNEAVVSYSTKGERSDYVENVRRQRNDSYMLGMTGQTTEKILRGVAYENFDRIVEDWSKRYDFSPQLKEDILTVKERGKLDTDIKLKDKNYLVVVVRRRTKLDISLYHVSVNFEC